MYILGQLYFRSEILD